MSKWAKDSAGRSVFTRQLVVQVNFLITAIASLISRVVADNIELSTF